MHLAAALLHHYRYQGVVISFGSIYFMSACFWLPIASLCMCVCMHACVCAVRRQRNRLRERASELGGNRKQLEKRIGRNIAEDSFLL